jgi:hypothetical protein
LTIKRKWIKFDMKKKKAKEGEILNQNQLKK